MYAAFCFTASAQVSTWESSTVGSSRFMKKSSPNCESAEDVPLNRRDDANERLVDLRKKAKDKRGVPDEAWRALEGRIKIRIGPAHH